jgi:hypothetical protein
MKEGGDRSKKEKRDKRGQITLFIIVGVLIVAVVLLFFFFSGRINIQPSQDFDPSSYIEKCIGDEVSKTIDVLLANGGSLNPKKTALYMDKKYNYLCYADNIAEFCVNDYPMLKSYVEGQIKEDTQAKMNACFASLKSDAERRGYTVADRGTSKYEAELIPKSAIVRVEREMTFTKGEQTLSLKNFEARVSTPIYNLIEVAHDIINDEADDCYTMYDIFIQNYPEISIYRTSYYGTRIYELTDRISGKMFKFAVRSCELRGSF